MNFIPNLGMFAGNRRSGAAFAVHTVAGISRFVINKGVPWRQGGLE